MATRTVRLDEETERMLSELQRASGESVSALLKRGIMTLRGSMPEERAQPYRIYETLDLGEGGYAKAPARRAKQSIRELLRRRRA
jgi:predicted transcriptional regulator